MRQKTSLLAILGLALALGGPILAQTSAPAPEPANAPAWQPPDPALVARARKLLDAVPLIDGHNDVPWEFRQRVKNHIAQIDLRGDTTKLEKPMMTDIPRLRRGGVGGQFWSVYIPAEIGGAEAVRTVLEQIDVVHRLAEAYPDVFEIATTADDIVRIHKAGKIASLIGMEGGHSIDNSLGTLRQLYNAGARYMTLTHSKNNDWADSATDGPVHNGLTPFGKEVVREMNRMGMLIDLSHVAPKTMQDAIAASAAPVIFSHSSTRALTDHPRDVPDDVLRLLPQNGGVVMVTFVPGFVSEEVRHWGAEDDAAEARFKTLYPGDPDRAKSEHEAWRKANPRPRATLAQVADHIEHARQIAGVDHIGLGSDFDGITAVPLGLEGVGDFPVLLAELLRRGWSDQDIQKLAGLNVLRVMRDVEKTAARLQKERPASDALIEELDGKQPSDKPAQPAN
jgi:membrane dipeptidase